MKITDSAITADNVFEQMALMTKQKLVRRGVLPSDADLIAVAFIKMHEEHIINKIVKDDNQN